MIKIRAKDFNDEGKLVYKIVDSTVGRVLFNGGSENAGYFNGLIKELRRQ